jgi:uncharacterized protein (TIGR02147 family)
VVERTPNDLSWRPDVFEFLDFRHYLEALRQAAHDTGKGGFTLEALAAKAGLKSKGHLHQILQSGKPLTPQKAAALAGYLFLGHPHARRYFELMAQLGNRLPSVQDGIVLDELLSLRRRHGTSVRQARSDPEALRYLRCWHLLPIRELAWMPGFQAEPEWIRGRFFFPPSEETVRDCLDSLVFVGDLMPDHEGGLRAAGRREFTLTDDLVAAGYGDQVAKAAAAIHAAALDVVKDAMTKIPREQRELNMKVVSLSRSRFPEFRRRLKALIDSFEDDVDGRADTIYQVHVSLIPITQGGDS